MDYVLSLSDIGIDDVASVGTKAAVLGDLRRAGFRVPDGFAVTTDGLRIALSAAEPGTDVAALTVPPDLAEQVATALGRLGDVPVAVRSSGVAEDLDGRSFAGMYESYLDVSGVDDVLDAVRRCWASGFSDRIIGYHRELATEPAQVAVLVQPMVHADAAGVAFSVNPVSGRRDEITVSAVAGLGDKLMSGESPADEWTVRDAAASLVSGDGTAVDATTVMAVADLVARVAAHRGGPQDMEWAVAGGEIAVLQARPVTGLSDTEQIPIEDPVPDGFWAQAPNASAPWVAMQQAVFVPVLDGSISNIFRYTTGARAHARMIHGRAYLNMVPDPAAEQVRKLEAAGAAVAAGAPREAIRRWREDQKPAFAAHLRALRATELDRLDDVAFDGYFGTLVRTFAELHDVYFTLAGAGMVVSGEFGLACSEVLGLGPEQAFPMLGGLDGGDHVPATTRLSELAAAAGPALREALADGTADAARLARIGPGFAAEFARYVADFGHRTIGFDIAEPTLAERPATLLAVIAAQLDHPGELAARRQEFTAAREVLLAEVRGRLDSVGEADRRRFEEALAAAEEGAPLRDEKVFYAVSAWALLRYATRELGRRLHGAGLADDPEDGFHIGLDAGLSALRESTDVREDVRVGRGRHAWALAHPAPPFYGGFTPPPGIDDLELSAAARHVRAVAGWSMSLNSAPGATAAGDQLAGVAASAGRYTGPVRVVSGIAEFGKLRKGDVLVCTETTSQWSVLFVLVGALVTDRGSLLSHPAIIAREYGVPAVVATRNATTVLKDGQLVTVDGSTGIVTPAAG